MNDTIKIYLFMILASFLSGLNDILKSYGLKYIPKSIYNSGYFILAGLFLTVLWAFQDNKNMTLHNILNLDIKQCLFIVASAICVVCGSYCIINAYSLNSTIKKPINIGILAGILSFDFIVAFIIDILSKLYFGEKIYINKLELSGLFIMISGLALVIFSRV